MLAVVDTGPLYAAVDADDQDHERCWHVRMLIDGSVVSRQLMISSRRLIVLAPRAVQMEEVAHPAIAQVLLIEEDELPIIK